MFRRNFGRTRRAVRKFLAVNRREGVRGGTTLQHSCVKHLHVTLAQSIGNDWSLYWSVMQEGSKSVVITRQLCSFFASANRANTFVIRSGSSQCISNHDSRWVLKVAVLNIAPKTLCYDGWATNVQCFSWPYWCCLQLQVKTPDLGLKWYIVYGKGLVCAYFHKLHFSDCASYFGTYVGKISNKEEGISGKVYCVDKNTIFIQNFTYTGKNSRKYLWNINTDKPSYWKWD